MNLRKKMNKEKGKKLESTESTRQTRSPGHEI